MATSLEDVQSSLKSFLGGHPEIKYIPRTSPDFSSVGAIFNRRYNSAPLAIVRPQTAEHVAALVSYCVANAVKFTIRSGGHSLTGQSKEQDALMIDMRDINYTQVNASRTSVAVGGGILQAKLIKDLSGQGLVTPTGSIKTVGYAGWGIYGGYGPLAGHYGLGLDNIIGAKIVNAKGQVVTADSELLKGIRGGGGTFGVIVELTVKVYPLKQILGGMIALEAPDFPSAYDNFNAGYAAMQEKGIPDELDVQQFIFNTPHGKMLAIGIVWSSDDHETGRLWIAKIKALGKELVDTIAASTLLEYVDGMAEKMDDSGWGSTQTLNIRKWTKETSKILGSHLDKMPSSNGTAVSVHELRGPSAAPNPDSVFRVREPHFMLEFISLVAKEEDFKESEDWSTRLKNALVEGDPDNVIPATYIAITRLGDESLPEIYGPEYQTLLDLKQKHDPQNVFSLAVPRLVEG